MRPQRTVLTVINILLMCGEGPKLILFTYPVNAAWP